MVVDADSDDIALWRSPMRRLEEEEEEEGEREGVLDVVVDASGRMVCETGSQEYCINVSLSCPESCPNPILAFKR